MVIFKKSLKKFINSIKTGDPGRNFCFLKFLPNACNEARNEEKWLIRDKKCFSLFLYVHSKYNYLIDL